MVIEQMVDIPADHRLTIEVPREVPAGRAILTFTTPQSAEAVTGRYAALENLRGIAKRMGSTLTVEQFLEMGREELELEEIKYQRHFPRGE